MDSNIILPVISLFLGLIGTFTKTSKDTEKGKRITIWGLVVAILILVSACITIVTNVAQNKKNVLAKETQEIENNNQRLLSLLSVSSNFQLTKDPYLLLEFNDELNQNDEPINPLESENIRKFPGFGIDNVSYILDLDISSGKHFIDKGTAVSSQSNNFNMVNLKDSLSIHEQNNSLSFAYEEINLSSINYLWTFKGYKNLTELLFDLQPRREIGKLTLQKQKKLTDTQFKKISKYLCEENRWLIRIFLKNPDVENAYLNLSIPIKLIPDSDKQVFILIPEQAIIGSPQFDPL